MKFSKDDPRCNRNGRPKGKPNRTTEELRQAVKLFINENWHELQSCFDLLEPKEKLIFLERLLRHVLPPVLHELDQMTDAQFATYLQELRESKKSLLPVTNN